MAELKREAARQGRTTSELVDTALRLLLPSQRKRGRMLGDADVDDTSRSLPHSAPRHASLM